jgi:DNA-binding beta-propeller fold protein YncE
MATRTRNHPTSERTRHYPPASLFPALIGILALLLGNGVGTRAADTKPTGYHLLKKATVGGEGGWDLLTVDPQAHRLYLSHATHVAVVDSQTGAVVGDIPNLQGVHGIAVAPALGRGFTSNGRENTVTIFDLKTLKEIQRVPVGMSPDAILFDPATKRVFSFNGRSNDATVLDGATGMVAGTIALGGKPEIGVSDEKGRIFVNLEDKSEVVALDAKALTVLHHWSLAPGEGPTGLAIDRKNRRLFSACGNEKMVILNADTGKVVATPTIGRGPDGCGFDPGPRLAFSPNGRDGTLTIIHEDSPDTFSVVETIPTQAGARTMELDPRTHHVFLVTADAAAAPAGGNVQPRRRPSFVPNTFAVLMIGK